MLGTAILPSAHANNTKSKRPRVIVFILADDMRWDAFGAATNSKNQFALQTPNLDWLAKVGYHFKNNFVTTSICPTSRASILTGQHGGRHGIWNFSQNLSNEQLLFSLPTLLRSNGYQTAFFGKWGIGDAPPKNLFDYWAGFMGQGEYFSENRAGHMTDSLSSQANKWLAESSQNDPVALFINTKAPHVQDEIPGGFLPTSRHSDLYATTTFDAPLSATEAEFQKLPEFLKSSEGRRRWHERFATADRFQQTSRQYHRLIAGIDDLAGSVFSLLKSKGLLQESLIAFSSDNGFLLGEHGLAGKWWGFEESIRTPLLIKLPESMDRTSERHSSNVIHELSLNIDVAPTILNCAGIRPPSTMQGLSLLPCMQYGSLKIREDFLYEHQFEHPRIAKTIGLRTQRHKYLRYPDFQQAQEMLFDLEVDPFEVTNLASSNDHLKLLNILRERTAQLGSRNLSR